MSSSTAKFSSPTNNRSLYLDVLEALRQAAVPFGRADDDDLSSTVCAPAPIIAITSPGPRDGKTFVATTLAMQLAAAGEGKVLLVDTGSPGKTSATASLAPEARRGWPEVARGEAEFSEIVLSEVIAGVDFLPSPPAGVAAAQILLRDPRYFALLRQATPSYCAIVTDCLGLSSLPVGQEFLRRSDAILMVLNYADGSAVAVREYLQRLGPVRKKIVGGIINRRRFPIPRFLYRLM
jgi:protein-tyrosine kinase